jgi:hypothetical protein
MGTLKLYEMRRALDEVTVTLIKRTGMKKGESRGRSVDRGDALLHLRRRQQLRVNNRKYGVAEA